MAEISYLEVARIDVQWGDVDRMQHVNNVVYFRWFETARTNYFLRLSISPAAGAGPFPILASIRCDYVAQLRHPDTVTVGYATLAVGRSSVLHGYRVHSEQQGVTVATGEGTWLYFDYEKQRPAPVPDAVLHRMEQLEGHPIERRLPSKSPGFKEQA